MKCYGGLTCSPIYYLAKPVKKNKKNSGKEINRSSTRGIQYIHALMTFLTYVLFIDYEQLYVFGSL